MNEPSPADLAPRATSTCRRCAARGRRRTFTARRARCSTPTREHFLHQSLSTPCFNALAACDGIWLEDVEGRRIMDFHGNNVHQVGYRHPHVMAAVKHAARHAAVFAAPLHERRRRRAGAQARGARARPARQGAVRARRHAGDRHGAEARARRHRPPQDAVAVGFVPRRVARRDLDRRRSAVPQGHRTAACPAPSMRRPAIRAPARSAAAARCNARCAEYLDYVLGKEEDIGAVIIETIRCDRRPDSAARLLPHRPRRLRPPWRAPDPRRDSDLPRPHRARCSRSSTTASFPTWS